MNYGQEYLKEQEIVSKTEIQKEIELIRNIILTKEELKTANINYEFANDDLIDYYIYQMKANQAKLNYLIKLAKTKGIAVDMIGEMKYLYLEDNEEVS